MKKNIKKREKVDPDEPKIREIPKKEKTLRLKNPMNQRFFQKNFQFLLQRKQKKLLQKLI